MARLVVTTPDGAQREHELRAINTLGRHPEQTVQILDRVVSKEHALITFADDVYWLQDIGSRNGTFINGVQVRGRTKLNDQDAVTMGGSRILFFADDEETTHRLSGNVTIHAVASETAIRSRLQAREAQQKEFLPEADILDEHTLRTDYEKLRVVFEFNQALGADIELDIVLNRILDKALEYSSADRGVILLLNEQGVPEPRASRHRRGDDEQIQLSSTILNEVLEQHHAVLSSDATMDSRFGGSHSIIMQGIRSTMCVPLMAGSDLLGMIHLDTRIATGVFTEKDLQILTVFANEAAMRIQNARLAQRAEDEAVARSSLSRLLSPNLVEQVVSGGISMDKGGTSREATVLFTDVRGFTSLSEEIGPEQTISLLNEFFEIMVDIVFRHEGTLDKFIGDELMAVWGAPMEQSDHVERAVRAALEMRRSLEDWNRFRVANGASRVLARTAINTGQMVAGYMGSTKTLSYTVIGDAVNTASRMCHHAESGQVLISDSIASALGNRLELDRLDAVKFKGKSHDVQLYNVLSLDQPTTIEDE
ncbi:MAG: adenylate/guanylate cyclase domain-containing protein [Bradymonadia bacterium]